ncbi:MAG: ATP-grasp enzyme, partial [Microcoleus sp. SIO2G3]|nr:ATP-grasp enzyme [Microcoleus sp. SIO2G3]
MTSLTPTRTPTSTVLKSLGTLALLLIALPINGIVVLIALVWNLLTQPLQKKPTPATAPKTIMLTGGKMTKALQLARSFHAAGHRVI